MIATAFVVFLTLITVEGKCPPKVNALLYKLGDDENHIYVFAEYDFWLFNTKTNEVSSRKQINAIWPDVPLPIDSAFYYTREYFNEATNISTKHKEKLAFRKQQWLYLYSATSNFDQRQNLLGTATFESEYNYSQIRDLMVTSADRRINVCPYTVFCTLEGMIACPIDMNETSIRVLTRDPGPNCTRLHSCENRAYRRESCIGRASLYEVGNKDVLGITTLTFAFSDDRYLVIVNGSMVGKVKTHQEMLRVPLTTVAGCKSPWQFILLGLVAIFLAIAVVFGAWVIYNRLSQRKTSTDEGPSVAAKTEETQSHRRGMTLKSVQPVTLKR